MSAGGESAAVLGPTWPTMMVLDTQTKSRAMIRQKFWLNFNCIGILTLDTCKTKRNNHAQSIEINRYQDH